VPKCFERATARKATSTSVETHGFHDIRSNAGTQGSEQAVRNVLKKLLFTARHRPRRFKFVQRIKIGDRPKIELATCSQSCAPARFKRSEVLDTSPGSQQHTTYLKTLYPRCVYIRTLGGPQVRTSRASTPSSNGSATKIPNTA
jgi:hypothetical protein